MTVLNRDHRRLSYPRQGPAKRTTCIAAELPWPLESCFRTACQSDHILQNQNEMYYRICSSVICGLKSPQVPLESQMILPVIYISSWIASTKKTRRAQVGRKLYSLMHVRVPFISYRAIETCTSSSWRLLSYAQMIFLPSFVENFFLLRFKWRPSFWIEPCCVFGIV